jgi:protein gp37
MADTTNISWCDATFNPFIGCAKVSPACDGCYAEALMGVGGRMGRAVWGAPGAGAGTRIRTSEANWRKPLAWDRKAKAAGARPFVFCASLADVFDNQVPAEWRRDLFDLIRATPHLTWLLLTKRPGNIVKLYQEAVSSEFCWCGKGTVSPGKTCDCGQFPKLPPNAAIGCTVVTQEEADRDIPKLLAAKAALNPAFAFVSMEPLLGPVELTRIPWRHPDPPPGPPSPPMFLNALTGRVFASQMGRFVETAHRCAALDWVITGGETDQGSHQARPSHPDWVRSLRDQCAAAGVAYHHKQNGEWLYRPEMIDARGPSAFRFDDGAWMDKIGKKAAGRLLDGVRHDARPELERRWPT